MTPSEPIIQKSKMDNMVNRKNGITLKRFTVEYVRFCCYKVWQDRPLIAEQIASDALLILAQAYKRKPCFFGGKSEKGILSGLLYYLGRKYRNIKTQWTIAQNLKTTEMTVRISHRNWIEQFSDIINTPHQFKTSWLHCLIQYFIIAFVKKPTKNFKNNRGSRKWTSFNVYFLRKFHIYKSQ